MYPLADSLYADYRRSVRDFDREVLGIKWISSRASRDGVVLPLPSGTPLEFWNERNTQSYFIENPDGIRPCDNHGKLIYKYRSSNVGAAVQYQGSGYRAVTFGFPLETIKKPEDLRSVLQSALSFLDS